MNLSTFLAFWVPDVADPPHLAPRWTKWRSVCKKNRDERFGVELL